jgi:conjugative relaxase-like TrwC/TraI family protein
LGQQDRFGAYEGVVGVTKIGRRNANYWINAVAEGGEDYYAKPGEALGQWMGDLAAELDLSGEVSSDEYAALFAGKHPKTGQVLVNRPEPRTVVDAAGKERRLEPILGYDIRFSAPKSVSLLWAIGSPAIRETVELAHRYAMGQALLHLEQHACFVQRGKGGVVIERGSGFIAMDYLHRSSRAGDPALHSHLLCANMTRAQSDGRWLSLANPKRQSPLLREAKAAGHIYQAALRECLTRELGVEWSEVRNGYADLRAIDREVIEHFSQRRAEIVAEMDLRGTSSPGAAEIAAYRTRDHKDYGVDPDRQRADWRSRAAEFGLTSESIAKGLGASKVREPKKIATADLDAAVAELEERHSHFDRRDLLCALANQMGEGASYDQLQGAVENLLSGERVLEIHRGEGLLGTSYFTTPRLWAMEQRVLEVAREGEDAGVAVVEEATLAAVLARHRYLGAEQAEMVRRLTRGGERIVTVAALPGSGKTTALTAAREAWSEDGHPGLGVASARSASGELAEAGLPATSITALLIRCEREIAAGHRPLPQGTVVVMDEASTTSTPQFHSLVELIEGCQGKLVCIGDPRQIGAVGPGGLFGCLTNQLEPVRLTEIRRQRAEIDRRVVELAHEGQGSDALDLLHSRERLVIADTLPEALAALTLDWHERFSAGEDAVMIARRKRDVAALNEKARMLLRANGQLGQQGVTVDGAQFAAGDRLITRINNSKVSNRERWQVLGVDPDRRCLRLRHLGSDKREVILGPSYLERRTENNEPAVQHAYALTTYATQAKTFDSAFALLDSGISREDFTVAVSRARGETRAYGVAASDLFDGDLGPANRGVEDSLHDLRAGAERVAGEFAAAEVSARKRLEALTPVELEERSEQIHRRIAASSPSQNEQRRLGAVERRISAMRNQLLDLDTKLAENERGASGARRLHLIETKKQLAEQRLGRLEQERVRLVGCGEERSRGVASAEERSELALIEDRLLQLRRREITAERLSPSAAVVALLGDRPDDPEKVVLWNEGVALVLDQRRRNGIRAQGRFPDTEVQRDRQAAELRLRRIQVALGREGASVERCLGR